MDRAALEVVAQFGQPEEALVLVEQREGLFQRLAAVHQGQRGLEGAGVVELDEVGDAAVDLEARIAALAVLGDPGAAFADRVVVAEGEREQQLDLADADVGPGRVGVGREADQHRDQAVVGEFEFDDEVEQFGAFVVGEFGQARECGADQVADTVVLELEFFNRINFGDARHQDAAGVDAEVGEVGDVEFVPFGVQRVDRPVVILVGGGTEIPVDEVEIRRVVQESPGNHAAGIDEVDFQVLRVGDFGLIEAGGGEARQRIERPALQ